MTEKACRFLRNELPEHVKELDELQLKEQTDAQLRAARRQKVKTERGMIQFVCLSVMIGDGFESEPQYEEIFMTKDSDPDANLEIVFRELNDQL